MKIRTLPVGLNIFENFFRKWKPGLSKTEWKIKHF